jgi:hypothetical protein
MQVMLNASQSTVNDVTALSRCSAERAFPSGKAENTKKSFKIKHR